MLQEVPEHFRRVHPTRGSEAEAETCPHPRRLHAQTDKPDR